VNRLADAGFVRRRRSGDDRREVLLALTPKGDKVLRDLSLHHKRELRNAGPSLLLALKRVIANGGSLSRARRSSEKLLR